jgi:hypothetical protein
LPLSKILIYIAAARRLVARTAGSPRRTFRAEYPVLILLSASAWA